ncbi:acid proteinase [Cubamyces sp. BRFM 1775]|nr:acid proteinase [Cubamyces sp. BRFM 1775]
MFSLLLLQVILAAAAFGIPTSRERHAQRVARRAANPHMSRPVQAASGPAALAGGDATASVYTTNWAGAVLVAGPNTYTAATGSFIVPTPREPSGGSGFHSAAIWVGIDGDTCQSAILQTGVDITVSGGETSYNAWYEWYPAAMSDFSGFAVRPGDNISATVIADSLTSGTATLINYSTGQEVTKILTSQPALCQENAEWIVEDYTESGGLVPLANFGTVTFTDALAGISTGGVSPAGATIFNMEQNGRVLTTASTSSSSVTVNYIGP